MINFNKIILIIAVGFIISLLFGCVSQKEIEYMQLKKSASNSFTEPEVLDYRLKPNDQLYIQITSLDDPTANVSPFSSNSTTLTNMDPYSASYTSYAITKEGYLQMPVIGNIFVMDKTLQELKSMLTDSVRHILSQPFITVKLVNRYFSVLGYVQSPGQFPYTQDKLSVYDAIAFAGDISVIGNREEVTLIRNENGKNTIIYLDLTNPEILASKYYFVRPNDILYIKPLKKRIWGTTGEFPWSLFFGTITTALLIYTVVKP